MTYVVLVRGGRTYLNRQAAHDYLSRLNASQPITTIIHGGERGADSLARTWAVEHSVPQIEVMADRSLKKEGERIRNTEMLDKHPDVVLTFSGGRGTNNLIRQAQAKGITVHIMDRDND